MANSEMPSSYALREFAEVDSTMDEARRMADAGERGPVWILAGEQTRARGRRGREWISPKGNLHATLLFVPECPLARCGELSFVAALAVAGAIDHHAGGKTAMLKWPNDVLLDGRKVAGLLLETSPKGDWLALGVGVNLVAAPKDTPFPAASLAEIAGTAPTPKEVLGSLAAGWAAWYDAWRSGGFAQIREAWMSRAQGLGQALCARLSDGAEMNGVFERLDDNGALVLRTASGEVHVTAGDVYFR